ncbi:MAG: ATP-dependent helicase/nuclease subunit A [Bacteroidia bacterium]|nr:ATP-dependent helicase/nuclease subunit A [Bacteroidia bacterium]MBX3107400.1 ATP-binding domain-containing protein [Bacteroidota bacterium]
MPWFIPRTQLDTVEQIPFLQQVENNPNRNYWLKGFAGSGKSVLLLHCLIDEKLRNRNSKAIIILYTHSLIDMIEEGIPQDFNGTPVVTYFKFMKMHETFDLILVDEIQDIPEHVLIEIESKRSVNGRIIVAGDINQSIYDNATSSDLIRTRIGIPNNGVEYPLNRIYRLSRRIRTISADFCQDKQTFLAAQVMDLNPNVPVTLVKANSSSEEINWLWKSSKEYADAGYAPAIIISNHEEIINFISSLLVIENKPPLQSEWINTKEKDYYSINRHLATNGIKLQYLGNKYGSFEKAHSQNLVTIITYHSSKGLDWKAVFIPFLKSEYVIFGDYERAKTLFFVALTRSREQLFLSYSGNNKHLFITPTIVTECTQKNAADELRRIQNPLGGVNNGEDIVVI